ncbi:MAG: hypothetical protein LBI77_02285 [Puniceicoccales bacterium]|jgi:hypothetical protein|nr:hypothetical protein [Puniceicoccales bacterium]
MNTENSKELNDAFKSADLNDKVWMFFAKYARALTSVAILALVVIAIVVITVIGKGICQRSMKAAYLEAIRTGNKKDFAQKYISKPLGGIVFLELADEAYREKEYQRAAGYYHRAAVSLGGNIFKGRAAIGEGVALIKSGSQREGETVLGKTSEEKSYPALIRANAMYLLAASIYDRKDLGRAKSILNQLLSGNFPDQWKDEARTLLQEIEIAQ